MIAFALSQNCLASQSRRFVAGEGRIISTKEEVLQALSIQKNLAWNPPTLRGEETGEPVDRGGKMVVNQRIRLGQFGVRN
jgi:hypothetical protein